MGLAAEDPRSYDITRLLTTTPEAISAALVALENRDMVERHVTGVDADAAFAASLAGSPRGRLHAHVLAESDLADFLAVRLFTEADGDVGACLVDWLTKSDLADVLATSDVIRRLASKPDRLATLTEALPNHLIGSSRLADLLVDHFVADRRVVRRLLGGSPRAYGMVDSRLAHELADHLLADGRLADSPVADRLADNARAKLLSGRVADSPLFLRFDHRTATRAVLLAYLLAAVVAAGVAVVVSAEICWVRPDTK